MTDVMTKLRARLKQKYGADITGERSTPGGHQIRFENGQDVTFLLTVRSISGRGSSRNEIMILDTEENIAGLSDDRKTFPDFDGVREDSDPASTLNYQSVLDDLIGDSPFDELPDPEN